MATQPRSQRVLSGLTVLALGIVLLCVAASALLHSQSNETGQIGLIAAIVSCLTVIFALGVRLRARERAKEPQKAGISI
ncbi:hypothetical protein [Humidisolicoccus flavus]|uniref:hypothetical protein n=1 Tax=Humidisolicoccus flavus TaxID=3111414 RepID=UPI0032476FBA